MNCRPISVLKKEIKTKKGFAKCVLLTFLFAISNVGVYCLGYLGNNSYVDIGAKYFSIQSASAESKKFPIRIEKYKNIYDYSDIYSIVSDFRNTVDGNTFYNGINQYSFRLFAEDYFEFPDLEVQPKVFFNNAAGIENEKAPGFNKHLNVFLLNENNNYGDDNTNYIYLTEEDAIYLIKNIERYHSCSNIYDIVGRTIRVKCPLESEIVEQEWAIANIILSDRGDSALLRKMYGSYVYSYIKAPSFGNVVFSVDMGIYEIT